MNEYNLIEVEIKLMKLFEHYKDLDPYWKEMAIESFERGFMAWQKAIKEASDGK